MHWEVSWTLNIRFLLLLTLSLFENILIGSWTHLGKTWFCVVFYELTYLSYVTFRHSLSSAKLLCYLHWVVLLIHRNLFWNLRAIINIKNIIIFPCCKIFVSLVLFFVLLAASYNIANFFPNLVSHFPHIGFWHITISK